MIDRGGYGWSEYVAHQPCSSPGDVERFYQRLGGYLAVFYALKANDMHFDNLIAAGEFPVPVDLETLFHPVVNEAEDPAANAWRSSVLRVLLLPTRILWSETQEGVDISGLGGKGGQYYPAGTVDSWDRIGTDEMRLIRDKPVPMAVGDNRPTLDGEDGPLEEFVEPFVAGFTRVYRLLDAHKKELQAPGGILDHFAEDQVRYLGRPTNIARVRGLLKGELPEQRFRNFCDALRDPAARWLIVRDYPVLFRSLYMRTINWVDYTVELLSRLSKDWDLIRGSLVLGLEPGRLTAISPGAGDDHRRGRTVAILEFSSGVKLVYKPCPVRSACGDGRSCVVNGW